MSKHLGPIALSAALLGLVGGVAAVQAFQPTEQPQRQVQFVQPAAETVTPSPTTTTATPTATVTVAPKPAPVESTTSTAVKKAPAPVQRQAVVAEPTSETTPSTSSTPKFGIDPRNGAPNPPPVKRPSPTSTN